MYLFVFRLALGFFLDNACNLLDLLGYSNQQGNSVGVMFLPTKSLILRICKHCFFVMADFHENST